MNIIEAIKERHSVRTYDGNGISPELTAALNEAIQKSHSPFGGEVTIRLKKFDLKKGYKPSTYGFIKGAEDFFLIGTGPDEASALSAGFRFEQVVLRARQLGLGTCWMAATFKGSDFNNGESWPGDQELKIVSPVGKEGQPSFVEKLARLTIAANKRKPFDDLFFYNDFSTALPSDNPFRNALEMLRLAPSSTNSQPWRALVINNDVHFYYISKGPVSIIDMGIGLCHFDTTEKFYGNTGHFSKRPVHPASPKGWTYLLTYTRETGA